MKNLLLIFGLLILLTLATGCGVTEQLGANCGGDLKELCHNAFGGRIDNRQDTRGNDQQVEIDFLNRRVAQLQNAYSTVQAQLILLESALSDDGANLQGQISAINTSIAALQTSNTSFQSDLSELREYILTASNDLAVLGGRVNLLNSDSMGFVQDLQSLTAQLNTLSTTVNQIIQSGSSQGIEVNQAIAELERKVREVNAALVAVEGNSLSLQSQLNTTLVQLATLNGYQNIVSIKDPCGKQGSWDEVLLRLSNGSYLASFSEQQNENSTAKNVRFVVLSDGNYTTTDSTSCHFTVSNNGSVISNEHN